MNEPVSKQPSVAELQERIDKRLQEALEKVLNRPFTMETVDDFRLKLEEVRLALIDVDRQHSYVDERAYSGVCYQLNYFRMCTEFLTKVCKENGLDFTLPSLAVPRSTPAPSVYSDVLKGIQVVDTTALIHNGGIAVADGDGVGGAFTQVPNTDPQAQPHTEEPIGLK